MPSPVFTVGKKSSACAARSGTLTLAHGTVKTPVFMPVGTQGTVKTLSVQDLEGANAQIILGNSYHLYLRPGTDIIEKAGGIHKFTAWKKPMLTDSGGFQIFSLTTLRRISDDGVEFQSHIDGSKHFFTPEKCMDVQRRIGADVIMAFDECPPYPCTEEYARRSMDLSVRWAKRCRDAFAAFPPNGQLLFGIIQGSVYPELRRESAQRTVELGLPGYALGGLSVGEPKEEMVKMLDATVPLIPETSPHYLMGVGTPEDIWEAVERGIDMFDCVLPTRNGRNGQAFTSGGRVNIRNAEYREDFGPLDPACNCPACTTYSRAYLNHLFRAQELLVLRLLSLHNIYFMIQLVSNIRLAIESDRFFEAKKEFYDRFEA